jgi:FkbM family methyltransferase
VTLSDENQRVIYDLGSNNGDDIPYYLKKAHKVVAVEANPMLCELIRRRFAAEITRGHLVLENCVLTKDDLAADVPFYIHKRDHVLSQFPEPSQPEDFDEVRLASKSVLQLIAAHGTPHYIKVDVEHYDEVILRALFQNDIRPAYISAESHSVGVFCILVALGHYRAFKLVNGPSVGIQYKQHTIKVDEGLETYSFPRHSAGPYGEDVSGEWISPEEFFPLLAIEGLGWRDIHATNTLEAVSTARAKPTRRGIAKLLSKYVLEPNMPRPVWEAMRRLYRRLYWT